MGLGIALGGFASGVNQSYGLGGKIRDDRRERRNRRQLEDVDAEGKQAFEAEGGEMGGAGDFDQFYTRYVVPKKVAALLEQGDLAGAEAFRTWGESRRAAGKPTVRRRHARRPGR